VTATDSRECDLLIRGGTAVCEDGPRLANVAIRDGRVVAIGDDLPAARRVIDATGLLVLPGCVDAHTHLNSEHPFPEDRRAVDDFASGTRAAAAGGITTVCDFVYTRDGESLMQAVARVVGTVESQACVDVALHVVITTFREDNLEELPALISAGFPSFKFYTSLPDFTAQTTEYLRLLRTMGELGGLAMFHCEDTSIVADAQRRLIESGSTSPRFYALSKPQEAEVAATTSALCFAAVANVPAYIVHLSSAWALDEVTAARERGSKVFVETRPLYLHLTESCFETDDDARAARFIGTPPTRTSADRDRLWAALRSGEIDVVGSDHVGFTAAQKYQPADTLLSVPKGSACMETMLPMLFSEGVRTGRITLNRCVEVLSTTPARIFGLYPKKGVLAVEADADLCIFDPEKRRVVDSTQLHSAADLDPFDGTEVTGWPVYTISRGQVIFEEGEVHGRAGRGQIARGSL
jgi:dihydropyrimidinase